MALTTPTSERVHVSLFGRTNAGKSTLMNRLVGYDAAIVSPTAGTTTDPVQKAIEINGLGAAVIIDTPGLDDFTELGGERMARTAKVLDKTDIAVVLFTDEGGDAEYRIIEECRVREIATIVVLNQVDVLASKQAVAGKIRERSGLDVIAVSALTGEGVDTLRAAIVSLRAQEERYITEGFCKAGDRV
ncbi:MAG: GTP-binding protein, partial [Alistipes sp.]|nr:GTP-binding protein [Alistipes sp.]